MTPKLDCTTTVTFVRTVVLNCANLCFKGTEIDLIIDVCVIAKTVPCNRSQDLKDYNSVNQKYWLNSKWQPSRKVIS